jgi:hypothetical protein
MLVAHPLNELAFSFSIDQVPRGWSIRLRGNNYGAAIGGCISILEATEQAIAAIQVMTS